MEENQNNHHVVAAVIRFIGFLVLVGGIALLVIAQLKEINIDPQNLNVETLVKLPKDIADKSNYTIIGGFLIVVGIQFCLVSTKLISEIKDQL